MNSATTVVALINKCVVPAAKQRLAAALKVASNPGTLADALESLVVDEEKDSWIAEYADTSKVQAAVLANPNIDKKLVRWLLTRRKIHQFELACGFLTNAALPFFLMDDPMLTWLSTEKIAYLSVVARSMRDYARYQDMASDLQRYERVLARIVEERQEQKEEAA
jgi:hypothetical protein